MMEEMLDALGEGIRFGEFLIRKVRPGDIGSVFQQRLRVAKECDTVLSTPEEITERGIEAWVKDWATRNDRLFVVVELGGTVVGQLWVWFLDSKVRLAHVAEFGLEVVPEHQGKGLGKKLVDIAISWARARGAVRIQAETLARNYPMVSILRRKGFFIEGVRHLYVNVNGRFEDALCFAKLFLEGANHVYHDDDWRRR